MMGLLYIYTSPHKLNIQHGLRTWNITSISLHSSLHIYGLLKLSKLLESQIVRVLSKVQSEFSEFKGTVKVIVLYCHLSIQIWNGCHDHLSTTA